MADIITVAELDAFYGSHPVLRGINLGVRAGEILAIIGPAHSGKTTLLRAMNRMAELEPTFRRTGEIRFLDREVSRWDTDTLRRHVGYIFATPTPLPGAIFDNVAYGPRLKRARPVGLDDTVERCLRAAFLWDEVRDRLGSSALRLSGGQQQRLCIARTLAVDPDVVLMDEPCSGLDPISTAQIEKAMRELAGRYTFILVTNNTKQAARVADRVAYFLSGELVELAPSAELFTVPKDKRTEDYLSGRIG
ncbi:MAG: phosphate ABC transporter ATP-binding protein [bacterium]